MFSSCKELMQSNVPGLHGVDPKKGLSLSDAAAWFTAVWENYTSLQFFADYKRTHGGRDWADEDLQSIMRVLTRRREPGGGVNITGYRKLMPARDLTPPASTRRSQTRSSSCYATARS